MIGYSRTSINLLGVQVDQLSLRDLLQRIISFVVSDAQHRVLYANVHVLNAAYQDRELKHVLNQADLVYCDGAGVKWGARLLGEELPERMTGADWIYDLCATCQERGFSLYFLGGEPGVAARAAEILQARYRGLKIAGTHHGHYGHDGPENDDIVAEINDLRPDILLVGFGTPLQEKWIHRNSSRLGAPVVWAVGALVDFVAGKIPRAPRWMLDHGLEWLYRLWVEPRRLWQRYVLGNPLFIWRVIRQRLGLLRLS
jgi:N-acetylglucosaminyldiphosphoundecaprenol N-acetyl-beta-D-mannosaminyltransferase